MPATPSGFLVVRLDQKVVEQLAPEVPAAPHGKLTARHSKSAADPLRPLRDILRRHHLPDDALVPALQGQSITHHLNLEEAARRRVAQPGRSLASYFVIDASGLDGREQDQLLDELRRLRGLVDRAYAEPQLSVPNRPTTRRSGAGPLALGHLSAAPMGIGVTCPALSHFDGSGIGFVDVEGGWDLDHRDLPQVEPRHPPLKQPLYGRNWAAPVWRDHGTAVLGVVLSQGKTSRIRGIAPGARFVGVASHFADTGRFDVFGAILAATRALDPGDVILIEAQVQGSGMPVEIMPHCMDAIRFAVASGLVVVEAAGNGAVDLDDENGSSPSYEEKGGSPVFHSLNPGSDRFLDSGAVLVSACKADHDSSGAHRILPIASFGKRVDCYAWGEQVRTLGEPAFDGTSSASAIIAGAVLLIQQMAKETRGHHLSPGQLRDLLRAEATGTLVMDGKGRRIGGMPDLERIASRIPGLTDLFIRDARRATGPLQSPDIIVRKRPSRDPEGEFGDTSGKADALVPMPPLESGRDHYVYVRVSRRLGTPKQVRVRLYSGEATASPERFRELEPIVVDMVPGRTLTVAGPIRWQPAVDQAGPRGSGCFVAVLDHKEDPGPDLIPLLSKGTAKLTPAAQTRRFVRGNDNVAWRTYGPIRP